MELPTLKFERAARPHGDGYKHGIRDHPAFCYVCTNFDHEVAAALFMPSLSEGLWIDHRINAVMKTTTMEEIAEAVGNGCYSCAVVKLVAENLGNGIFDPDSDREVTLTYCEGTTMTIHLADEESKGVTLELFTTADKPCPWPSIGNDIVAVNPEMETWQIPGGKARAVSTDPLSEESLSHVWEWISRCELEHPYCRHDSSVEGAGRFHALPKRLIFVGTGDEDVRLEDATSLHVDYTALSYCWGQSSGLSLLKDNEKQLYDHMPQDQLLEAHKDAIQVTRKLGLDYLWTDALCIRQNDMDEKAIEIANMASIYARAYITITSSSSRNGGDGFLQPRPETHKLPIIDENGNASVIWARQQVAGHAALDWNVPDSYFTSQSNAFTADALTMSNFPIFSRGWTFQERLLSPRILHFTNHEITWECLGMTCCECGTMDDFVGSRALRERRYAAGVAQDVEIKCGQLRRSRKLAERYGLLDYSYEPGSLSAIMRNDYALMYAVTGKEWKLEKPENESSKRWRDLITQYSRRNLSFDSDTLPAVSGLADAWATLEKNVSPKYLAGLWQDSLLRDMLWKCTNHDEKERPAKYLAPTWSWASIRRAVEWLPANELETQPVYHVSVLDAACEVSGANSYGEVTSGYVKVKGPMMRARITSVDDNGLCFVGCIPSRNSTVEMDCIPEARRLLGEGIEIYCLWWSTDVNDPRTGRGWERALVLRPHENLADTFTRIGIMEHFPAEELEEPLEEVTLTIV